MFPKCDSSCLLAGSPFQSHHYRLVPSGDRPTATPSSTTSHPVLNCKVDSHHRFNEITLQGLY